MLSPAYIRTFIPLIVGLLATLLARYGFDVDEQTLTNVIGTGAGFLFYVLTHYLETHKDCRWGWLLGYAAAPVYPTVEPADERGDGALDLLLWLIVVCLAVWLLLVVLLPALVNVAH